MPDGSVKIEAQGSEKKLLQFISCLKKGSMLAKVEDVSVEWTSPSEFFEDFKIIF